MQQLPDEPRLADPGLPQDRHHLPDRGREGPVQCRQQHPALGVPSDERAPEPELARRVQPQQGYDGELARATADRDVAYRPEQRVRPEQSNCRRPEQDLPGCRLLLDAGRDNHRVTDRELLLGGAVPGEHLAGVDTDREREVAAGRFGDRLQREGRCSGAAGVVLAG